MNSPQVCCLLHLMRHRKFVTFDKARRKRWKDEGRKFLLISLTSSVERKLHHCIHNHPVIGTVLFHMIRVCSITLFLFKCFLYYYLPTSLFFCNLKLIFYVFIFCPLCTIYFAEVILLDLMTRMCVNRAEIDKLPIYYFLYPFSYFLCSIFVYLFWNFILKYP